MTAVLADRRGGAIAGAVAGSASGALLVLLEGLRGYGGWLRALAPGVLFAAIVGGAVVLPRLGSRAGTWGLLALVAWIAAFVLGSLGARLPPGASPLLHTAMVATGGMFGGTILGIGTGAVVRSPNAWWTGGLLGGLAALLGMTLARDWFFAMWQAALGAHTGYFASRAHADRGESAESGIAVS